SVQYGRNQTGSALPAPAPDTGAPDPGSGGSSGGHLQCPAGPAANAPALNSSGCAKQSGPAVRLPVRAGTTAPSRPDHHPAGPDSPAGHRPQRPAHNRAVIMPAVTNGPAHAVASVTRPSRQWPPGVATAAVIPAPAVQTSAAARHYPDQPESVPLRAPPVPALLRPYPLPAHAAPLPRVAGAD